MKREIRKYIGKLGEVTVTEYTEDGKVEYHVVHHGLNGCGCGWFKDWQKADAIAYAQFLAGKY